MHPNIMDLNIMITKKILIFLLLSFILSNFYVMIHTMLIVKTVTYKFQSVRLNCYSVRLFFDQALLYEVDCWIK